MRKLLKLTGVAETLTKEAQEKLDKVEDNEVLIFEDLTCEDGRTREQYENLGIKVPKDLIQKEKDFDKDIDLEDEDFETLEYPCRIFEDEIVGYVESEDKTTIFTRPGMTFSVKETAEQIDELINNN